MVLGDVLEKDITLTLHKTVTEPPPEVERFAYNFAVRLDCDCSMMYAEFKFELRWRSWAVALADMANFAPSRS
jgi:hypothetical protein